MEVNSNIELSIQGFFGWLKTLNKGHKRLWSIVSIIWVLGIMIPSLNEYYSNVKYCSTAVQNNIATILNSGRVSSQSYKRCIVKPIMVESLSKKRSFKSYKMTAKEFNFMSILWALTLPIGLPIILYVMEWVRSGYKHAE